MKTLPLAILTIAVLPVISRAQTAHNPKPTLVQLAASSWRLDWVGAADVTYFIQWSDDLETWHYFPVIEHGTVHDPFNFGSETERFFVRLKYVDNPDQDPETGDFDGDGVNNINEVGTLLTDPLLSDTDGNGISDYDEDRDSDGWADGKEANNGTDHETMAEESDSDGDLLLDVDDADPGDAAIDWERTKRLPYAWVPLDDAPSDPGPPVMINDAGHVLFENALWVDGSWQFLEQEGVDFNVESPNGDPRNMAILDACYATFVSENDEIIGWGTYTTDQTGDECVVFWHSPSANPVAVGRSDTPPPVGNPVSAYPGAIADGKIWLRHSKPSGKVLAEYSVQDDAAALVAEHQCASDILYVVDALGANVLARIPGDGCALFDGSGFTVLSGALHSSCARNLSLLPTGRLGIAANDHLWVWGGAGAWKHSKPITGAIRLDGRGDVLAGYGAWLWRNGRTRTFVDMFPRVIAKGFDGITGIDMNSDGVILMQAYSFGDTVAALAVPLEFATNEIESGLDDFERLLEETDITRPWLAVPNSNQAAMEWDPDAMPLDLDLEMPAGKIGSVLPTQAPSSPSQITVTDQGPHDPQGPGYDGFLIAGVSRTLGQACYPVRNVKLAVHEIILTNDDEEPEYSYEACYVPGKEYPAGATGIEAGKGKPDSVCVTAGLNGILDTSACGGDDHPAVAGGGILTGKNGICETTASGDDAQPIAPNEGESDAVCITPGPNGVLNTYPNEFPLQMNPIVGADDVVVGETITTGPNGIRETDPVCESSAPNNVPTQAELEAFLERVYGDQANIKFTITQWNQNVEVAFDTGDQDEEWTQFPHMAHPNGYLDYFYGDDDVSPEEALVAEAANDPQADFNVYFFGCPIASHRLDTESNEAVSSSVGYARTRSGKKTPYIAAHHWNGADLPTHKIKHAAAHEMGHLKMRDWSTRGLHHPRWGILVNGQTVFVPFFAKKNYTLMKEDDDKLRLMWPFLQDENPETGRTPVLLLKSECDDMHGGTHER